LLSASWSPAPGPWGIPDELDADWAGLLAADEAFEPELELEEPPPHPASAIAAATTAAHVTPQAGRSLLLIISVRPPSVSRVRDRRRFDLDQRTGECAVSFRRRRIPSEPLTFGDGT
jgi:hypothetical protein